MNKLIFYFEQIYLLYQKYLMGNKQKGRQELNIKRQQSEYLSNKKNQSSSDYQFPVINQEKLNQVQKLQINCSVHNHEAIQICVYKNCKSSLGICNTGGCKDLHMHQGRTFLVSVQELNRRYAERVAIYETYYQTRQKYMNQIYEQVLNDLSNVIKFVKKDSDDMNQLFEYCNTFEDDNFKMLHGKIYEVERAELARFLNSQPKKICENKFQMFNSKLLKRKFQFTKNLSELQNETNKFKTEYQQKTLYEQQKISRIKTTIKIEQIKWDTVFEQVKKLKDIPINLVLASDVRCFYYFRVTYYFISDSTNISMTKFANFLKIKKMEQVQTLKLYTNWYIQDLPEFKILAQALQNLKKLRLVTIVTRHPIKSADSFSNLKNRIELICQEWEQKRIVIQ